MVILSFASSDMLAASAKAKISDAKGKKRSAYLRRVNAVLDSESTPLSVILEQDEDEFVLTTEKTSGTTGKENIDSSATYLTCPSFRWSAYQ